MAKLYSNIPHVDFNGFKIYHPLIKASVIRGKGTWTHSQLQRQFKIGFNATKLLVEYMQSIGVLGEAEINGSGSKFTVID